MSLEIVGECIKKVIENIDRNPFIVHSEQDIQAMLYCELTSNYNGLYPLELKDKNNKNYKTLLVHNEYYFGRCEDGKFKKGNLIDIAIYNREDTQRINTHYQRIKSNNKENIIKLDHVIEIKFEKGLGGKNINTFEKSIIKQDIEKLCKFRKCHKKYRNHNPKLHFVYILRLWKPKNEIKKEIENVHNKLKDECKKHNIEIHFNKNQFLE